MAILRDDPQADLILNGHPWRVAWQMSWPAVVAITLFGLNAMLDAIYIGRLLGQQALAGAVMAYPLTQITLGLGSLAGIGGGVALSIAIGKGDQDTLRRLPGTALTITAALALVYGLVGGLLTEPLVRAMGARDALVPIAADYLRASAIGSIGALAGMALNMLLRGEGRMKLAALYMGLGLMVNMVLTPLLIVVFDLGVAGAAWATNIGNAVGAWLVWRRYARGRASYPVDPYYLGLPPALTRRILRLGTPAMIMSSMGVVQAIVVFNVLSRVGSEADIAFYGAAWRIMIFMLTPLFGIMRAFQPVAGFNYGAGQWERVRTCFWTFVQAGAALIVPIWALMAMFPGQTLSLMLPGAQFSDHDLGLFRILILPLPLLPLVFTALALLPAIEQPGKATIVSVSRQLLFYVPVMLLLPPIVGVRGVYYGSMVIELICATWLFLTVTRVFRRAGGLQASEARQRPVG
ncbi:MATE family efflux transporter [Wenzhouxiangella limi]|uniref:MATE family efflux transporter n=1 Tax=Wenzhouxiangella limi TaxID=2707351 RepID=A0A845V6B0_9GAMM|nr:MATE family efflux transporter [Wenzhouxiangella limi]NDY96706.1 MATE family efflux transporter [Wenzhouxiangella limi]